MIMLNGKSLPEAEVKDTDKAGHPGDLASSSPKGEGNGKARIIRVREVCARTGLARTTVWTYATAGTFPKPIRLGPNAAGWVEAEVDAWITARISERGAA